MPNSIVVRTAELRDSDAIVEFNTAMALETEGRTLAPEKIGPGVRSLFEQPELGFYLVAEIEGEIAGSLMISKEWSDWRNGLYWWIQSVYIPEKFRRRGVYREMYAEVKRRARENPGIAGIRLYVEVDNEKAQATYKSLGMEECHYKVFEELF